MRVPALIISAQICIVAPLLMPQLHPSGALEVNPYACSEARSGLERLLHIFLIAGRPAVQALGGTLAGLVHSNKPGTPD